MRRRAAAALPTLAAAALLIAACGTPTDGRPSASDASRTPDGRAASACVPVRGGATPSGGLPNISLRCLEGGAVTVGRIRGPAIVNLWASWCGPCRTEMPALARAARQHPAVTFLGVDTEDERTPAVRFLHATGVRYPQLLDPDGRVLRALGLAGLPATFAVDASGRVLWQRRGGLDAAGVRSAIAAAQGRTAQQNTG